MKKYIAVITKIRKCEDCDSYDDGIMNRMDCGCCWEEEVGQYDTVNAARLAAMAKAKKKGRWGATTKTHGKTTGDWRIETEEDGTVEWGHISKALSRQ